MHVWKKDHENCNRPKKNMFFIMKKLLFKETFFPEWTLSPHSMYAVLPIARGGYLRRNTLVNQESSFTRLMTVENSDKIAVFQTKPIVLRDLFCFFSQGSQSSWRIKSGLWGSTQRLKRISGSLKNQNRTMKKRSWSTDGASTKTLWGQVTDLLITSWDPTYVLPWLW